MAREGKPEAPSRRDLVSTFIRHLVRTIDKPTPPYILQVLYCAKVRSQFPSSPTVSRAVPTRVRVRDYIAESTAGTTRHKCVGTPAASDMMVPTVRPRLGNTAQRWPFCFVLFWVHRKTRRCLSQRLPPRKIMQSSTPHSSASLPLRPLATHPSVRIDLHRCTAVYMT